MVELRRWQAPLWGDRLGSLLCRMYDAEVRSTGQFTQAGGGRVMLMMISRIQPNLNASRGSAKRTMPRIAVPTVPKPVYTAYAVPDWQRPQRVRQLDEAQCHAGHRSHGRQQTREAMGILQANRPTNLEEPCHQ